MIAVKLIATISLSLAITGCATHHYNFPDPSTEPLVSHWQEPVPSVMQEPPPPPLPSVQEAAPRIDYGPQIVMVVIKMQDGHKIVVPVGLVVFNLVPSSGPTAKSPLNFKDRMICQAYNLKVETGQHVIAERCGSDVYLLEKVIVFPPPDKKKGKDDQGTDPN